jgi:hypothetical protein
MKQNCSISEYFFPLRWAGGGLTAGRSLWQAGMCESSATREIPHRALYFFPREQRISPSLLLIPGGSKVEGYPTVYRALWMRLFISEWREERAESSGWRGHESRWDQLVRYATGTRMRHADWCSKT